MRRINEQVVRKICDNLSLDYDRVVDTSTDRSGADVRYSLNSDKTHELGWQPLRQFNDTLIELIEYYRESLSHDSVI